MKVTFFSNYMNHHQRPFCDAMYKKLGKDFYFVATDVMSPERQKLGYDDPENERPYVLKTFLSKQNNEIALKLGKESDVVIIGCAPDEYIIERLKANKLTFRYSERYFKQGRWRILDPRVFISHYKRDFKYRNKNLYMLCASAYTAPDCRFIFSYPNKTYRWGYFPPVKIYDDLDEIIKSKRPASILWVGRFLKWKHPEASLYVAKRLKDEGYSFTLDIIGNGELEQKIKSFIVKNGLENYVRLLGTMSPEKVREYMEQSEIFLFTSDKNEGWGAVLNESMNSACAVVANKEIGSVPYLIKDGENGLTYKWNNLDDLYKKIKRLLKEREFTETLQKAAYKTVTEKWNAETAAERLLHLINCIQKGVEVEYKDGPCSKDVR